MGVTTIEEDLPTDVTGLCDSLQYLVCGICCLENAGNDESAGIINNFATVESVKELSPVGGWRKPVPEGRDESRSPVRSAG